MKKGCKQRCFCFVLTHPTCKWLLMKLSQSSQQIWRYFYPSRPESIAIIKVDNCHGGTKSYRENSQLINCRPYRTLLLTFAFYKQVKNLSTTSIISHSYIWWDYETIIHPDVFNNNNWCWCWCCCSCVNRYSITIHQIHVAMMKDLTFFVVDKVFYWMMCIIDS